MTKLPFFLLAVSALALSGCTSAPSTASEPAPTSAPVVQLALSCDDLLSLDEARAASGDPTAERLPEPAGPAADLVCLWGGSIAPWVTVTVDRATGIDFDNYRLDNAEDWALPTGADDGSFACGDGVCDSYLLVGNRLVRVALITAAGPSVDDGYQDFQSLVATVIDRVVDAERS